jgi:hypothetical protein
MFVKIIYNKSENIITYNNKLLIMKKYYNKYNNINKIKKIKKNNMN